MIPTDTLDSFVLREVFAKMSDSGGFKAISYGLSVLAITLALLEGSGVIAGVEFIPAWSGAFVAVSVVTVGLSYSYYRKPGKERLEP